MSQQEFEPRAYESEQEAYAAESAIPRDESPLNYGTPFQGRASSFTEPEFSAPWWARPQQQQQGRFSFALIMAVLILLVVLIAGLGVAGVVLGALWHLLGIIIGAILLLCIFVLLLVLLIIGTVGLGVRGALRPSRHQRRWERHLWHAQRRLMRRTAHAERRFMRRAAHEQRRQARRMNRSMW